MKRREFITVIGGATLTALLWKAVLAADPIIFEIISAQSDIDERTGQPCVSIRLKDQRPFTKLEAEKQVFRTGTSRHSVGAQHNVGIRSRTGQGLLPPPALLTNCETGAGRQASTLAAWPSRARRSCAAIIPCRISQSGTSTVGTNDQGTRCIA